MLEKMPGELIKSMNSRIRKTGEIKENGGESPLAGMQEPSLSYSVKE